MSFLGLESEYVMIQKAGAPVKACSRVLETPTASAIKLVSCWMEGPRGPMGMGQVAERLLRGPRVLFGYSHCGSISVLLGSRSVLVHTKGEASFWTRESQGGNDL